VKEKNPAKPSGAKGRSYLQMSGASDAQPGRRDGDSGEKQRILRLVTSSRQGYANHFDAAPLPLVRFDRQGIIRDVNGNAGVLLGEERSALIGTSFAQRLSTADAKAFLDHLQKCAFSGDCAAMELHLHAHDGRRLRLRLVSSVERDGTPPPQFLSALTDLSSLVAIQERTEILNAFPIDDTRDLAVANAALRLAIEEAEAFNAAVAHDLRSPLAAIDMCAQAVSRHCGPLLDKECRSHLSNIVAQTGYMNQLIAALMNFSRVSRRGIQKQPVDLAALARTIATQLRLGEPERRVRFDIPDRLMVSGEPCLLQEVMDNLMGNAWKYSAGREPAVIEVGREHRHGTAVFFVRDNGIGFKMEDAPGLFKIFKRLPGTEAFKGYGVGLAMVQRIIRRHGGRVWAESAAGRGATFYFTVPE